MKLLVTCVWWVWERSSLSCLWITQHRYSQIVFLLFSTKSVHFCSKTGRPHLSRIEWLQGCRSYPSIYDAWTTFTNFSPRSRRVLCVVAVLLHDLVRAWQSESARGPASPRPPSTVMRCSRRAHPLCGHQSYKPIMWCACVHQQNTEMDQTCATDFASTMLTWPDAYLSMSIEQIQLTFTQSFGSLIEVTFLWSSSYRVFLHSVGFDSYRAVLFV